MLKRVVITLSLISLASWALADQPRYRVGLQAGAARLFGGDKTYFPYQPSFGFRFSFRFHPAWSVSVDLSRFSIANDTTSGGVLALGGVDDGDTTEFKATRLGIMLGRELLPLSSSWRWSLNAGGGLLLWKFVEPVGDTVMNAAGPRGQTEDFATSELLLSAGTEIGVNLTSRWSLALGARADYLTGLGVDFADSVNAGRDRWLVGSMLTLAFGFGPSASGWRSTSQWVARPKPETVLVAMTGPDSDGDGVADALDRCPNTAAGVIVDQSTGCPRDSDGDGVVDGRDDCPDTDRAARGQVDINGCPIDSDFDGVPDYLDRCPANPIGAAVDSLGCPLDEDGDGVPDGLDDCPHSLPGAVVDPRGCLDLSIFAKPMVLNIDYVSGSYEIDPKTEKRLQDLARVLTIADKVRIEINGYTDNIGLPAANQKLSQKRAERVRDHLVALGVAADRIQVFGRGESSFVASNDTAEGRAANRRVEIVFYQ